MICFIPWCSYLNWFCPFQFCCYGNRAVFHPWCQLHVCISPVFCEYKPPSWYNLKTIYSIFKTVEHINQALGISILKEIGFKIMSSCKKRYCRIPYAGYICLDKSMVFIFCLLFCDERFVDRLYFPLHILCITMYKIMKIYLNEIHQKRKQCGTAWH